MEESNIFVNLIVLILIFGGPLFFIGYIIYQIIRYRYWYHFRSIEPKSKRILEDHYLYYRDLPQSKKKRFENRVVLFIRSKDWYGQDGLIITQEMKVLVAATAVQITFGFRAFQLPRFDKVFIYPRPYYNSQTKNYHKGEVYPMGKLIRLSWDNFLKGFDLPDDGINLGLHEMTHAMSLENRFAKNGTSNFISPFVYRRWRKLATKEIAHIKSENNSLFRAYAATNLEEFLSVTVEVFFEKPNEFKVYNPLLFEETCNLLNQYPVFEQ